MAITEGTCNAKDALTLHIPSTCTCVSSVQVLHTPAVKGSLWHSWKDTKDKATTLADGSDVTVCAYYLLQSYQGRGSRKPSTPSKTSFEISVCTCAHMPFPKRSGGIWVWFPNLTQSKQVLRARQAPQVSCAARCGFWFTLQRYIRSQAGDMDTLIKQKSMPNAH